MSEGKSVRLFLADGMPGGLLTAEIMNWTGHVIAAPRSDLAALLKRPETSRTGMYILLGDDPDSAGGQAVYIGEGDDVNRRLYLHSRSESQNGKDFWDRAIVLTSKDFNLTKAHARYLESRFISLAKQANRASVVNGTTPPPIVLPEADVSDMEYYIEQAKIILPVLGVNVFRSPQDSLKIVTRDSERSNSYSPILEVQSTKSGILATAQEVDGEFTVLEGSTARATWVGVESSYTNLRQKLEQDGTLSPSEGGQSMRFTRNYVFASPSAAAAVILGRSTNGRSAWTLQGSRKTYGEWETEGIDEAINNSAE